MHAECACDGGPWGVSVCWACLNSQFEADYVAVIQTETEKRLAERFDNEIDGEEIDDEEIDNEDIDDENTLILEELLSNWEEDAQSNETGWPYDPYDD